jgi:2-polyprenyl-6-methoxyphenol hydroxylase-like FAD-dependent oxidoreductase
LISEAISNNVEAGDSMSLKIDTDVLIAGAGPVGLFLANECARRGIRFRLIEERAGQSVHSKALAIFPRTMEILEMAGLVGPFLDQANRVTGVSVITHGRRLAHMRFAPEETPYSFVAMVPQNVSENLLLDELRRRGGKIRHGRAERRFGKHHGRAERRTRECDGIDRRRL